MTLKVKIKAAIRSLRSGRVIAFPTETVFGLGALLDKPAAIRRIFKLKKRPRNKPLQVLVGSLEQAEGLGKFSRKALAFARRRWPGPYTLIVPRQKQASKLITGGSDLVGLRVPDHPTILKLIKECGPIVATSANISGEKPFLNSGQVKKGLKGLALVLPGRARLGKASKVIDTTRGYKVLRP